MNESNDPFEDPSFKLRLFNNMNKLPNQLIRFLQTLQDRDECKHIEYDNEEPISD